MTRFSTISTTICPVCAPMRLPTTNLAPNMPKTPPEAPSVYVTQESADGLANSSTAVCPPMTEMRNNARKRQCPMERSRYWPTIHRA